MPSKDGWEGLIPELTEDGNMELGSRVVVFSQFKGPLKELESRCNSAGISCVRFDGDTPQNIRDEAKMDFDRKYAEAEGYTPKWQVMLANYRTGGVGLNFTAATETIILDKEWSPGKQDQAYGRTDRLGQTEHTNVHVLRIPRTIDVWMDQLNDEKAKMIDGFNSATEDLSKRLLQAMTDGEIM
jgi:SNF2 family DNA or RNA helicase